MADGCLLLVARVVVCWLLWVRSCSLPVVRRVLVVVGIVLSCCGCEMLLFVMCWCVFGCCSLFGGWCFSFVVVVCRCWLWFGVDCCSVCVVVCYCLLCLLCDYRPLSLGVVWWCVVRFVVRWRL